MTGPNRPQADRVSEPGERAAGFDSSEPETAQSVELREEQLVAHKELRELGEIEVRTEVEDVPGRLGNRSRDQ